MVEAGEDDLQHPGADRRVDVLGADDLADDLERRSSRPRQAPSRILPSSSSTWRRASAIFASGSRKGRPWPGRQRSTSSGSTSSRPREELADRVGAVAVVEEEDGAAEQVVAGDQQLALGLVQDDVRGGVAGGLVDLPGAEVGLDLDPGQQVAVGLDDRVDPGVVVVAAGLAVALQRRRPGRRSGGRPRSAARAPPPGSSASRRTCSQAGCIQSSQPAFSTIGAASP